MWIAIVKTNLQFFYPLKKLEKQKHGSDHIELFLSGKLDHFIIVTILSHCSKTVQLTKIE